MKISSIFAITAVTIFVSACGTSDGAVDEPIDTELTTQRHHHPPPPPPPPQDSGVITDSGTPTWTCDICTKAQACCLAVNGGCTFSTATCFTYPANQQSYYFNSCLVEINLIRSVWRPNVPAACL